MRPPPHAPHAGTELEEFFDLSIDLLCVVGFDGHFKRVNPALERTLGYPRPELFARSVFDITHPDDVEPSRAALAQLAEGHDMVGFESRVVTAGGAVRWLEWNTRTVPERGVVYGVARDTTERRHAEAKLREAQGMLEANRDELRLLAAEQAALRRVATLVARETPPHAMFAAVAEEIGEVLGVDATHLGRYDSDGTIVSVAQWGAYPGVPIGARFALEGDSVSAQVLATGRPARMESYADATGDIGEAVRRIGIRFSIGVPITVDGRPWGVMIVSTRAARPFPAGTESRLQDFTELLATAISNASAHDQVRGLADEQAALRRIATLVAQQTPQAELFAAIVEEIGRLLRVDAVEMVRYEDDRFAAAAAGWGRLARAIPEGSRLPLGGRNVTSLVFRTGRAVRLDDYGSSSGAIAERVTAGGVRAAVGTPIFAEGRLWGAMIAASTGGRALPPDTESRIGQFTNLMATAIANAEARDQLTASRARVLAAADDARRRVVRDLHDGAQQRLVHTIVTLKFARQALRAGKPDAEALVAEALGYADEALTELRELSHGILPSVLIRGGLSAAVDAVASRLEHAIDVDVDIDVAPGRLPRDVEASAYFIVAEALTNVVKHARARRAVVRAAVDDGRLRVEVRDDGAGGADAEGDGLVGLADRVDALGGELTIDSADGGGTAVVARLPLSADRRWLSGA